ncbi:MAG: amidase family protein, partial [Candidatus Sulfotelmatobacter sp.]
MPKKSPSASTADRRSFLQTALAGGAGVALGLLSPALSAARASSLKSESPAGSEPTPRAAEIKSFELDEITISQLQEGMKSGKFTARSLVEKYAGRIDEIDKRGPAVNSILELNPDALAIADALDQERKAKGPRGPLHGVPVLIKDNIDTADKMMT